MPEIVVRDGRAQTKPKTYERPPIGAVVAYQNDENQTRRGVVVASGPKVLSVLDGERTVRLINERRDTVKMLAVSTEAYAERVMQNTNEIRAQHNWCGVPTNAIRDVNNTEAQIGELVVVVKALQVFRVLPTGIALRRNGGLNEVLAKSWQGFDLGSFDARSFLHQKNYPTRAKFTLEVHNQEPESA